MTAKPCTSPVIEGLPPANSPIAVLVDVRTGQHPDEGFDRVVFDFRDDTSAPGFSVSYVEQIIEDPRGTPLQMLPGAKLLVDMRWAAAHEDGQPTVPPGDLDLRPGLPRIKQVKRAGDFEGLLAVLDPEVVFRVDAGPAGRRARPPIEGATAVARQVLERGTRLASLARHALVNGAAGLVVGLPGRPLAVVGFTVSDGRIAALDLVIDPDKLRRLPPIAG